MTLDALQRGLFQVQRLLRDVDRIVTKTGERKRARPWYIERLHSSNPTVTVRPGFIDGPPPEITIDAVVSGIRAISRSSEDSISPTKERTFSPPPFFTDRELDDLRQMSTLRTHGVSRIEFEASGNPTVSVVTGLVSEQVDRILRSGTSEYGSVDGVLDAINLHRSPSLTIWHDITGLAVRVNFPASREDDVRALLRKRVRVTGRLHSFADGRPRHITEFRDIEDISEKPQLKRAAFGSIPDLTGGRGSATHLRLIRDA